MDAVLDLPGHLRGLQEQCTPACTPRQLSNTSFGHDRVEPGSPAFFGYLAASLALLCTCALMAGLTIGFVSLDAMQLQILRRTGSAKEKRVSKTLEPFIQRHHLVLVTLVIGNAIANEALPVVLEGIVSEYVAVALSVSLVLLFGEILPSAVFSGPRGPSIAAALAPLMWTLIAAFYVIGYPLSRLLDYLIGAESHGFKSYRRSELKALLRMHSQPGPQALVTDEAGSGGSHADTADDDAGPEPHGSPERRGGNAHGLEGRGNVDEYCQPSPSQASPMVSGTGLPIQVPRSDGTAGPGGASLGGADKGAGGAESEHAQRIHDHAQHVSSNSDAISATFGYGTPVSAFSGGAGDAGRFVDTSNNLHSSASAASTVGDRAMAIRRPASGRSSAGGVHVGPTMSAISYVSDEEFDLGGAAVEFNGSPVPSTPSADGELGGRRRKFGAALVASLRTTWRRAAGVVTARLRGHGGPAGTAPPSSAPSNFSVCSGSPGPAATVGVAEDIRFGGNIDDRVGGHGGDMLREPLLGSAAPTTATDRRVFAPIINLDPAVFAAKPASVYGNEEEEVERKSSETADGYAIRSPHVALHIRPPLPSSSSQFDTGIALEQSRRRASVASLQSDSPGAFAGTGRAHVRPVSALPSPAGPSALALAASEAHLVHGPKLTSFVLTHAPDGNDIDADLITHSMLRAGETGGRLLLGAQSFGHQRSALVPGSSVAIPVALSVAALSAQTSPSSPFGSPFPTLGSVSTPVGTQISTSKAGLHVKKCRSRFRFGFGGGRRCTGAGGVGDVGSPISGSTPASSGSAGSNSLSTPSPASSLRSPSASSISSGSSSSSGSELTAGMVASLSSSSSSSSLSGFVIGDGDSRAHNRPRSARVIRRSSSKGSQHGTVAAYNLQTIGEESIGYGDIGGSGTGPGVPIRLSSGGGAGDGKASSRRGKQLRSASGQHHQSAETADAGGKPIKRSRSKMRLFASTASSAAASVSADADVLSQRELGILEGTLDMRQIPVSARTIPLRHVFMLSSDAILDPPTLRAIVASGHSRVPVYRGRDRNDIAGVVLVKLLLEIDWRSTPEVRVAAVPLIRPLVLHPRTSMLEALRRFQTGRSHMALISRRVDEVEESLTRSLTMTPSVVHGRRMLSGWVEGLKSGRETGGAGDGGGKAAMDAGHDGDASALDLAAAAIPLASPAQQAPPSQQPAVLSSRHKIKGIITLEDCMEQLLRLPINDEMDILAADHRRRAKSKGGKRYLHEHAHQSQLACLHQQDGRGRRGGGGGGGGRDHGPQLAQEDR